MQKIWKKYPAARCLVTAGESSHIQCDLKQLCLLYFYFHFCFFANASIHYDETVLALVSLHLEAWSSRILNSAPGSLASLLWNSQCY